MNYIKMHGNEVLRTIAYFMILTIVTTLAMHELSPRHTVFLLIDAILFNCGSKLFDKQKVYYFGTAVLMAMLSSIFIIRYLTPTAMKVWEVNNYISFAFAISNLVLIAVACCKFVMLKRILTIGVLCIIGLPLLGAWGYYFSEHAWLNVDAIMAILQTNAGEAFSYIKDRTSVLMYCIAVAGAVAICYLVKWSKQVQLKHLTWKVTAAVALFALLNTVLLFRTRDNFVTSIYIESKEYQANYDDYAIKKGVRRQDLANVNLEFTDEKGIYVLVIGESANRTRMSAYGYELDTTPWLKAQKEKPNMVLFENAYSCHVQTVPALTYALTAKNQYNGIPLEQAVSVLDMAEAAGYETVWLSNQVKYGSWGTPITVIADEANQQIWINCHVGNTLDTNYYDGELIKRLNDIKMSDKMLIVVHLMGSHISYHSRYPNEFNCFFSESNNTEYDNSILYTDYVLQELVKRMDNTPNFKCLMYFSDHGEAVNYGDSHDPATFKFDMAYIPFFIHFSDDYISKHKDRIKLLKKEKADVITDDLIFNTLMGVMDIKDKTHYEAENDLTSGAYNSDIGRFVTLYGKVHISDDKK